jgi:hypothetical protein
VSAASRRQCTPRMASDADSLARTALRPLDMVLLTAFREYEAAYLAHREADLSLARANRDYAAGASTGPTGSGSLGGLRSAATRSMARLNAAFAALNEAIGSAT